MAGWNFTEVGISVNDNDCTLKKQLMDCIGLEKICGNDFSDERCSAAGEEIDTLYEDFFKDNSMIFDEHPCCEYLDTEGIEKIAALLNMIFPETYLNAQHNIGTTVTSEGEMTQFLIDPNQMIITKHGCGEADYRYAYIPEYCEITSIGYTDQKTGCYECISIKELNQKYKEFYSQDNPGINDEIGEYILEELLDSDFSEDFFNNVIDQNESIEAKWEGKASAPYDFVKLDGDYVRSIIEKSTEKGYTELTALLNEKCKDVLES